MTETARPDLTWLTQAFVSDARRAAPTPECPSSDRLWEAVSGDLPPSDVEHLLDHVATCAFCTGAWQMARGAVAESRTDAGQGRARSLWRLPLLVAAASIILTIGLFQGIVRFPYSTSESPYRAADAAGIRSLVSETEPIPRRDFLLRWSPGPPESRYAVRIATEDLETIAHETGLATAEYTVPGATLANLPAGSRLFWQIVVTREDGSRQTSATFIATLQ